MSWRTHRLVTRSDFDGLVFGHDCRRMAADTCRIADAQAERVKSESIAGPYPTMQAA